MEKNIKNIYAMSDKAILDRLGKFIQDARLSQNKTQQQLADKAGINRSTIVSIEKGAGGTLLTFIEILRQLERLHLLGNFETNQQISPLTLAKLEENNRKRASRKSQSNQFKSDW